METPNSSWFYGGPTYKQTKMLCWNALKALSPPYFVKNISETDLTITYLNGSQLWVIGFDKRERFEGKERWNGGVLDEYANMDAEVWPNTVEPALRDSGGPCHFIGKPVGRNHYFELSEFARSGVDAEWEDFNWWTEDVLDPLEIAKAKARVDERTFNQEYRGEFVSYEGRAYVYHDTSVHRVVKPFNPELPVTCALDFNISPCLWELAQIDRENVHFFDEIRQTGTDIWRMCAELKRRLEKRGLRPGARLVFYGDYTSASRRDVSATAASWDIIRGEFHQWQPQFRLRKNPNIVDRINAVNSRLRSADGRVRLTYDPKCAELGKDFELVDMEMLTTKKGQAGDRTHASDAVGYLVHYEWDILGRGGIEVG